MKNKLKIAMTRYNKIDKKYMKIKVVMNKLN